MTIHPPKIRSRGFTLIELMITVSIAAILMMVAVPSFTAYRRNAELTSVANKVVGSINAARGEALKRGMTAFIVPLDNGTNWDVGWAAFVDKSATRQQTYNATAEGVVSIQQAVPSGISVVDNRTAPDNGYLMFDASGFSRTKAGGFGALALTIQRNDVAAADLPQQTRFVIVSSTGRVRVCKPLSSDDAKCRANSSE